MQHYSTQIQCWQSDPWNQHNSVRDLHAKQLTNFNTHRHNFAITSNCRTFIQIIIYSCDMSQQILVSSMAEGMCWGDRMFSTYITLHKVYIICHKFYLSITIQTFTSTVNVNINTYLYKIIVKIMQKNWLLRTPPSCLANVAHGVVTSRGFQNKNGRASRRVFLFISLCLLEGKHWHPRIGVAMRISIRTLT